MTSRERVQRAIHFQGPDQLPHFLPDGKENDILWLWPGRPDDIKPWAPTPDGRQCRVDAWGVVWETMGGGSYGEAIGWPLADITKQAEYVFPPVNDLQYVAPHREAIAANNAGDNPKYCLGVMPVSNLHEGVHTLTGLHNMLEAYYEHPDHLHAFLHRLAAAQRGSIRNLADCGCDGVMAYDDWGLQDRLMISPALFEEFFLPHYRANWSLAHELGMDVWLHSCGYIVEILPMMTDAGLNVIQMDQQENIGLETLDAMFGGKIAFWCPVDIQQTMVHGSVDEVRAYVRRMVDTIGSHNGGLVSMAYSTPDAVQHAPEKTTAMCDEFRRYGAEAYRKIASVDGC